MNILDELENLKEDDIVTKPRNTRIIDLVEGDILVGLDGELQHVSSGEVSVFANGLIDDSLGILTPIDQEAVGYAIAAGKTIFNMEDI